jgi:trigger factor
LSTSTLTRLAPTQVELEIPITAQELADAEERAFRHLVKKAKLPGFRAGKAPRKVFEQAYGSDTIASRAVEDVVPEVYARAVREHALEPVDRPRVELISNDDGRPTGVKAIVDVRPTIELGQYQGIEVEADAVLVTDAEVEQAIQALAKQRATLVPLEREARLGDVVTIDYEGCIDGTPFEGGSASGQSVELEDQRFIPGFASGIAGMRAGESKRVEALFPQDYPQAELAGKNAVFAVTLHDVKALELPTVDDEFARAISDNETLEALRADVRKRLEAAAAGRRRRRLGDAVMEKLLAAHDFDLPHVLVEREIDAMVEDVASQAARDGIGLEERLQREGRTIERLREEFADRARTRVKGTLLIEQIGSAANIVATPADVAEELAALSRQYGQPVERIRKALGGNLHSVMEGIVRSKTLDFLIDNAVVTEKEATPQPPS